MAFSALEQAQEDYIAVAEEEEIEHEGDYLEAPSNSLESLTTQVHERVKNLEKSDRYVYAKDKFKHSIENFGKPSGYIEQLCAAKEISMDDMRLELAKIETSYELLKSESLLLDPSVDHALLLDQYKVQVVDEVEKCKLIGLRYMKDSSTAPTPVVSSGASGSRAGSGSSTFSTTKR